MATRVLNPKRGTMTARVFDNPHTGIPPTLFFDIEIPVRPFKYKGKMQRTEVLLNFINFRVADWRELPGREFTFPTNPKKGYIDGSMYLDHAHNPADTTRIRFGPLKGKKTLPASLDIEFDFTFEGPEQLGKVAVTSQVDLRVEPEELDKVIEEARQVVKPRKK